MKAIKIALIPMLLLCSIVSAQVAQFPQIYFNAQGSGGFNLNIHSSASSSSSAITSLSTASKIGAESLVTNSSDPTFMNFIKVCIPSTSSTNNTPSYGFMASSLFYAQINESNNYAIVNTASTPLGVRTCAGCTNSYVTSSGQSIWYGKNSILALTGSVSSNWYEIFLPNGYSQSTGWVNGQFLTLPASQNYYVVGGNICDNSPPNCQFTGNINKAVVTLGSIGTIYSSGGYYEYKVAPNWSGAITCSFPLYNSSSPTSYSHTATSHNYSRNFYLSNSATCTPVSINTQPQPQSAAVGGTGTFTVSASGTAPFTYQWRKNGSNISGATNPSYITPVLTLSDNGNTYSCFITNCNGANNITSNNATLTVTNSCTPVSINSQPQPQPATVGGTATFTVSVSGTAPFTYQWRKNGSNILGATNPSYTTPVLTLSDNGNTYSCYVTNCNGLHNSTSNSATLTVTTSQNGVISGTVIAPDISDLSGMVVNNTVNATVKIFNSGSSTPINTTTAIGGNFSFNSLATGNYDIEASIISGSVTYKTTKTNIQSGTSNISVKLSSNVIEQIAGFNTQLSNLNCYLEDLGQTIPSSVSYNMSSSYNYINNKRVLTNSYESDIEALLRLAMAERLLVKYYGQARTMSQEFVKSADEFAKAAFDLVEMVSCTPTPNLILKELSNSIIDCVSAGVKLWMGVSYGKIYFEAAIDGTVDGLKAQGIPLYSIYNTQRNWIHPLYLSGSLKNNYIKPTLSLPNAYVSKSQNYDFTGSLQNTVNSNNSLLYSSENNTAYAQGYADGLRNSPMWIEFLYDLSPNFSCVNPYVRITSVGLKVIEITFLGMSISKSVKRSIQLTNEVHPNAVNSYYKTDGIQNSIFNKSLHDSRSINAANAVDNFEAEYFNTINELSAGNYSNLTAHITSLVALNKELNEIVNDETQAIKSALYFLSMEDSVIVSSLQNTIISSPLQRAGLLLALTYLNENQSEQQLKDSILAYSNLIYTFNALMLNELNVLANSVSGAQSPPYISVKQSNIPLVAYPSTGVPIVLKVKNHGSTNASNVYLKLEIAPLATFSTDSIYIGSLLADEEKDVSFTLYSSTIEDSLSFYTISIHGDSILSNGKGGATLSRKNIISNVSTIDKRDKTLTIYPNPNNGIFRVTTEITTEKISYLKLYSSLGQLVYSKEIMPTGNRFDETISTTNLLKGIYTLQMNIDGKLQSKKMIIQ